MNKERGKLGSCFDYQMTGTVLGLCAARLCPHYISPTMIAAPFSICISVFPLLVLWTAKKVSLCILHLLCSNVSPLFSMWACSYQGPYAHFINSLKAAVLHSPCPACKQLDDGPYNICECLHFLRSLITVCC